MTRDRVLAPWQAAEITRRNPGVAVSISGVVATIHPVQGAPGPRPAGSATAIDCEGVDAMHKPIEDPIPPDTPRGRRMAAALAIVKMETHQLSQIGHWLICPREGRAVSGYLPLADGDPLPRLLDWAAFLAAGGDRPVPQIEQDGPDYSRISVRGHYAGVPVEIWYSASQRETARVRAWIASQREKAGEQR